MDEKYREFYRLKTDIINSLRTISEGDRMDTYSDNFVEDKTNAGTFADAKEMMERAEVIMKQLVEYEKEVQPL